MRSSGTDKNKRWCNLCNIKSQTEAHVLLECPQLHEERQMFWTKTNMLCGFEVQQKLLDAHTDKNSDLVLMYLLGNIPEKVSVNYQDQLHVLKMFIFKIWNRIQAQDKQNEKDKINTRKQITKQVNARVGEVPDGN